MREGDLFVMSGDVWPDINLVNLGMLCEILSMGKSCYAISPNECLNIW